VLEEDLFIPILTFVFGEAELGGSVAVMSYHRLQNELYGLPPDRDLLAARTAKEALHELGHAYGLVHCPDIDCVMHTSTDVEAVDLKGTDFCSTCRGTLHTLRNGGRP
jgi:archaemetzincin